MKRILSIVLAVMMLTLPIAALADEYDVFKTNYTSGIADISVTMSVNEPMDVLDVLAKAVGIDNFVNLKMLGETLCDSEVSGVVKFNSNEDYTKMQLSYEVSSIVPVKINRNAKITGEVAVGMWINWDITDELNPVMNFIYSSPACDKYISMDISQMMENTDVNASDFASAFKSYLNKEHIDKLNESFVDIIRKNSSVSARGTKIVFTVSAEQMKNIIGLFMDEIIDDMSENKEFELLADGDAGNISDVLPDSKAVNKFFEKVSIFDNTALTMEVTKNPSGTLKTVSSSFNFAVDVKALAGLTNEEILSDVPSTLKFSVKEDVAYSGLNSRVNVQFPALNSENSISVEDLFNSYAVSYEFGGENCPHDEYTDIYCAYEQASTNTFYVSLKELTDEYKRYGYDYKIKNEENVITLSDAAGLERFSQVVMTDGSNEISVDGAQYTVTNPVKVSDGKVFIDTDAVKYIFGADMNYASVRLDDNELNICFDRKSPQCPHTQEQIDNWYNGAYEGEYCEHYQYIYCCCGQYPYNGVMYVSLREFVDEVTNYNEGVMDISYNNGVITLTDLTGSESFKTATITVGSNEVYADGALINADNPAVEYNDTVFVDVSTVKALFGVEMKNPRLEYQTGYYDDELAKFVEPVLYFCCNFERKSPLCTHTDEEIENESNPWDSWR